MKIPEKGFYYHYKRNPEIFNDHTYEVIGVGRNTEEKTQYRFFSSEQDTPDKKPCP